MNNYTPEPIRQLEEQRHRHRRLLRAARFVAEQEVTVIDRPNDWTHEPEAEQVFRDLAESALTEPVVAFLEAHLQALALDEAYSVFRRTNIGNKPKFLDQKMPRVQRPTTQGLGADLANFWQFHAAAELAEVVVAEAATAKQEDVEDFAEVV